MNAFITLKERGFFYQLTDEKAIESHLSGKKVSFYCGIDPTASSMHVGHMLPFMACRWLQHYGHTPMMVIGGGTAKIGDPSGKIEARKILDEKTIHRHSQGLQTQLSHLMQQPWRADSQNVTNSPSPVILNNESWLKSLNYIDFLRDIGVCFSVNKMLTAESVKLRLKQGLSFLEFNYMLLQAYDFYVLARDYNCQIQLGGQDQWGNIVSGIDLIRRLLGKNSYGITCPLLTDKHDRKFGKTVDGAVWLDKEKTSPYLYYQFWRNSADSDIEKLLALYTTLPMDEVRYLGTLPAPDINRAKEVLAYEATSLVHGHAVAEEMYLISGKEFGFSDPSCKISTSSSITHLHSKQSIISFPAHRMKKKEIEEGIWIVKLLVCCGLSLSNGEARRLLQGGGVYLHDDRVTDINREISLQDFLDGKLVLRVGKKKIRHIIPY